VRLVFQHFIDHNNGAVDNVKSVVIDKDYKEWAVLEQLFPKSTVVLCQFHVLKWLKHVIAVPKYGIDVTLRAEVMKCIHHMVYAVDRYDLDHYKLVLEGMLTTDSQTLFQDYMERRWYKCERMWSNPLRGQVFTAGNTTSNRIESYWNQFKYTLGRKQRIDACVEAIFVHATSVLRREHGLLVRHVSTSRVYKKADPFLDPLLDDLSPYAGALELDQWDKLHKRDAQYFTVAKHEQEYSIRTVAARVSNVVVSVCCV
jgi:hypothetical protein